MSKGAAAISIVMALVLGFVVGNITGSGGAPAEPTVAQEHNANTGPAGAGMADAERVPVGTSPVLGSNNALVTIVEFSDFQCPFCSRVEDTIHQIRQQYGNDVRIVWKNAPLPFHNNATPAAEAAQEAFAQGGNAKFWQMHGLLYQHNTELDRPHLDQLAQQVGLDMTRYRAAMDAHTHVAAIEADKTLAQTLGASGTPNFFINGTQLTGAQPFDRFKTVIDQVLARARTIQPRNRVYAQMVADPVPGETPTPSPTRPGGNNPPPQQPSEPDPAQVMRVPVGNSPVQGPNTALVTMVVFSDFQCPFCSRVETTIAALRTRYGNDLRVVWKNEPLPFHDKARPAAEAAMEAFAQRGHAGFWAFHGALFAHQDHIERADLEALATAQHLDMTRFRAALDGHTHAAAIDADHALAQSVEANGTPHMFINGRRLVGAQPEAAFATLIDETKRSAEAFIASHPGTTRANVYERMMAAADTTVRHGGGNAPSPAAAPTPPAEDENRVYTVRDNPNSPSWGPRNARVVIQHFSDYQCPYCSRVGPAVAQMRQRYGDRVRFVWRDFPLPFHSNAMPAAEAAQEAFAQRGSAGFWLYHDALFANQEHIERADLEALAVAQHLDMARFRAALDGHTHQARIQDDIAAANATGASIGTPAFFINGKFVAGALPFEEFQRRIEAALAAPAAPR